MYEPQKGTWTLTGPDGRTWTGESGLLAAASEQNERIPPEVQMQRIMGEIEHTNSGPLLVEISGLIHELHDEADLCRNETATDIAYMLETAADMIDRLKDDALTMALRLLGEDDDSFAPETRDVMDRWRKECAAVLSANRGQGPGQTTRTEESPHRGTDELKKELATLKGYKAAWVEAQRGRSAAEKELAALKAEVMEMRAAALKQEGGTETCYSAGDMADQGAKQYRAGYAEGQKDMREACAKVCDDIQAKSYLSVARSCANDIRAMPITEGDTQ